MTDKALTFSKAQAYGAEALGTFFLLATVIGSGIMADQLSGGNIAIALLGNTIATGAILVVLITMLGPISGAHFNPVVTLAFRLQNEISSHDSIAYVTIQIISGFLGVVIAHSMFGDTLVQHSQTVRAGLPQFTSEIVATFGLVFTILATVKVRLSAVPMAVGLYITAAYWFTASTSFANPAVTIARTFSDTFAGIRAIDVAPFIAAQIVGAILAWIIYRLMMETRT